jgi:hypothetical protein
MKSAMKHQFPNDDCHYCYFHLAKAAWTQIQKKGLLPIYSIPEVQVLLRSYPALAFLPVVEIGEGVNDIDAALTKLVRDGVIERRFIVPLNSKSAESGGGCIAGIFRVFDVLQSDLRGQSGERSSSTPSIRAS